MRCGGRCPIAAIRRSTWRFCSHRDQGHGPRCLRNGGEDASVLFDATLKEPFPPISLPKREYMENARKIWEELGLPPLKPQAPWFGMSLGEWDEQFDVMAKRAVKSDYWVTGDIIAQQRRNDVPMNTETPPPQTKRINVSVPASLVQQGLGRKSISGASAPLKNFLVRHIRL